MNTDATTNECYSKTFLSIKSGSYNEHRCYNGRILQRTVLSIKSWSYNVHRWYNERMLQGKIFIHKIRKLQWTQTLQRKNATANSLSTKSWNYNVHRWYNERMLQRKVFIHKIRKLQFTQMVQQTNVTENSVYPAENQEATMNTDATTNAGDNITYYGKFDHSFH